MPLQTPNGEHSKITEISQTPVYILITLMITLIGAFGGIPGIFQIISKIYDKPSFKFHQKATYINGYQNTQNSILIIFGTLENVGEKPLFTGASSFTLNVETENKKVYNAENGLLPKNLSHLVDTFRYDFKNINDLEYVSRLNPSEPISGALCFIVRAPVKEIANPKNILKISCYDLNNIEYSDTFHFPRQKEEDGPLFLIPKLGVSRTSTNDTLKNK